VRVEDFDFELPEDLIAQQPAADREGSRLMVLDRSRQTVETERFPAIVERFRAGDLLVVNDTRVIPARLLGQKQSGGRIEVFLVRPLDAAGNAWLCMTRASKPVRPGTVITLPGEGRAEVLAAAEQGLRKVRFSVPGRFADWLESNGDMPLPPYIRRPATDADRERYQTVFAQTPGALAAPTAGLHFSEAVFDRLRERGVEIRPLTLHVGLGTFLPVRVEDPRKHRMHSEAYEIPSETAGAVNRAREEGRRVVALGTTTTRTLEAACDAGGRLAAGGGETDIFIYPGFDFRIVDALVTNFHLPRSTLLMLVSAFAGRDFVLAAYRQAVAQRFRFFSYGDCMFIV
jgi:S-adenosylmethionine:tRNA ribosyltransferase-isomerase